MWAKHDPEAPPDSPYIEEIVPPQPVEPAAPAETRTKRRRTSSSVSQSPPPMPEFDLRRVPSSELMDELARRAGPGDA